MFQAGVQIVDENFLPDFDNKYFALFLDQASTGQNFVHLQPQGESLFVSPISTIWKVTV